MELLELKSIIEALVMAAAAPISVQRLRDLLLQAEDDGPTREEIETALTSLREDYATRGIELADVAGGYRFQTRARYALWVGKLWEERKPRYSRALLETLAIIAYRQPLTRGEIEAIRGVAVSTGIIKTLLDREWVKVVGHRDVPGRPEILATTRQFLEYFNLTSLSALPTLAELKDFEDVNADLFAELDSSGPPAEDDATDSVTDTEEISASSEAAAQDAN